MTGCAADAYQPSLGAAATAATASWRRRRQQRRRGWRGWQRRRQAWRRGRRRRCRHCRRHCRLCMALLPGTAASGCGCAGARLLPVVAFESRLLWPRRRCRWIPFPLLAHRQVQSATSWPRTSSDSRREYRSDSMKPDRPCMIFSTFSSVHLNPSSSAWSRPDHPVRHDQVVDVSSAVEAQDATPRPTAPGVRATWRDQMA